MGYLSTFIIGLDIEINLKFANNYYYLNILSIIIHINTYYCHKYTLHKHKALFHKHINFNLEKMEIFD